MFDLAIVGGEVIDGTGRPRFRADVGIRDGRIARVGTLHADARETLDASGRIIAPGFVDLHTHYDAQVFWDGTLSPSPLHGVTSVIGGNCGFSIAPLTDESGDYLMRMLARVEAMPLESLREGVPWDWRSFGEYLDRLEGRIAVNAGFLVGHSALRRAVLAERSDAAASNDEVAQMGELLAESLAAGGLGFSSSRAQAHADGDGNPVPSRGASEEEILSLCRVVRDHPGTTLEFIASVGLFEDGDRELMTGMSLAADRPLNWNVLVIDAHTPDNARHQLAASDHATTRGANVIALTPPMLMKLRLNLRSGFLFELLPDWAPVLRLPLRERMQALARPDVRATLAAGAQNAGLIAFVSDWPNVRIDETFLPEHTSLVGRSVGELAEMRGTSPLDALLDLALSEDLRTSFMPQAAGDDPDSWKLRSELWQDERLVLGASDAGAHLDMIDTFTYSTELLGPCVRDRELLSLEAAVRAITDVPARLVGLHERGRIAEGWHADVTVFDPESVAPGPIHTRMDLPAGAGRLFSEPTGIDAVIVGGVPVVRAGAFSDARPGRVLRSGRDTHTVTNADRNARHERGDER